jgi:hypothetical protein
MRPLDRFGRPLPKTKAGMALNLLVIVVCFPFIFLLCAIEGMTESR